ncbi:hypothetical protein CRG98_015544 [Punica granatum]|uniref:WRKY domain-containing protein n=1 Tax=Punica granatum TaxID=22663 RepID=A0A2I0K7F6_PUNGR|nr:hypothetical protein CRG98_015544 [Punica granatum]
MADDPDWEGKGSEPLFGDPDPTTEVTCTHRGCQRPWRWGRGRKLAAPTTELIGISKLRSRSIRKLGLPIGNLDPTLEVSSVLCGC